MERLRPWPGVQAKGRRALPTNSRVSFDPSKLLLLSNVHREKRRLRDTFHLSLAVHKAEYDHVKRPRDKKTKHPIEPAHRFEINLEGDSFTKEK